MKDFDAHFHIILSTKNINKSQIVRASEISRFEDNRFGLRTQKRYNNITYFRSSYYVAL